jgi:hypothetical protein
MSGTPLNQPGSAKKTGSWLRGSWGEETVGTRNIMLRRIGTDRNPSEQYQGGSALGGILSANLGGPDTIRIHFKQHSGRSALIGILSGIPGRIRYV